MNKAEKTAWIDEENKIVSFHAIDNGEMIIKAESLFWDYIYILMKSGYRIMRSGASIKRTHTHTKSAYMQPAHACRI